MHIRDGTVAENPKKPSALIEVMLDRLKDAAALRGGGSMAQFMLKDIGNYGIRYLNRLAFKAGISSLLAYHPWYECELDTLADYFMDNEVDAVDIHKLIHMVDGRDAGRGRAQNYVDCVMKRRTNFGNKRKIVYKEEVEPEREFNRKPWSLYVPETCDLVLRKRNVHDVLYKLKVLIGALAINIMPFFRQFDYTNNGRCTVQQFKRGFYQCGFGNTDSMKYYVSEEELDDIVDLYRDKQISDNVKWFKFVIDLSSDPVNHDSDVITRTYPLLKPEKLLAKKACVYWRRAELSEDDILHLELIISDFKKQLLTVDMLEHFKYYDKNEKIPQESVSQLTKLIKYKKINEIIQK